MVFSILLLVSAIVFVQGFIFTAPPQKVCFGDLGCFENVPPFKSSQRLISMLPKSPQDIQTLFLLYTRANPTSAQEETLSVATPTSISGSHYDANKPTKFVVHGFTHNAHRQWVQNMISQLLKHEDMNVIAVDWSHGAGLPYGQATANTRVVGAQIAQLINYLVKNTVATTSQFHIIGHSLGAHIGGYAGEKVTNLGRITGLDPAGPYFENTAPQVRLDPTDADFVDVMHTDGSSLLALGFGTNQAMGHVDFYPNGGVEQPGCDNSVLSRLSHTVWNAATLDLYGAEATVTCSHIRSSYYFTESINSQCPFQAYPCTGQDEFNKGHCLSCLNNQCSRMGYHADKFPARGSLYLKTQPVPQYCSYHYMVKITSDSAMDGIVKVTLHGTAGDSSAIPLMSSMEVVNSGGVLSHLITSGTTLGNFTGITVSYDKTNSLFTSWMYPDDWKLMGVTVLSGETQKRTLFCAYGKDVMSHSHSDFPVSGHCT